MIIIPRVCCARSFSLVLNNAVMKCNTVFRTDNLREHIFSHADNQSLAQCARVCEEWKDTYLDILWEKLFDPIPLLAVSGPMNKHMSHLFFPHRDLNIFLNVLDLTSAKGPSTPLPKYFLSCPP